jgi:hypothetical protein
MVAGAAKLAAAQGCLRVALVRQDVVRVPMLERYARAAQIDSLGTVQRQTWAAFEVFLQVARQLTRFDAAAVMDSLRTSAAVDTGGLVPALNFTTAGGSPGLSRVFNPTVTYQRLDDGRYTELHPGFEDLTPVLTAAVGR